jgi:hypothetical protein
LSYALHGDGAGNIYLFGNTGGFDPTSVSLDSCTITNASGFRFVFKLVPDGQVLWCRKLGSATDCGVDALGNCFITGALLGTVSFDSITLTNAGGTGSNPGDYPSYFLANANPQGTFVWAKMFGADDTAAHGEPAYDSPTVRVAVDAQGDCSFSASLNRTNSPFDSFSLTTFGIRDAVVARLDAEPPRLEILRAGDAVVLSWPTNQPAFVLESVGALGTNVWAAVTNGVTVSGTRNFVTNFITEASRFYRLRKP